MNKVRRISAAVVFLGTAGLSMAALLTGPGFDLHQIWLGGGSGAAANAGFQHSASIGQPVAGGVIANVDVQTQSGFFLGATASLASCSMVITPGSPAACTVNPPSGPITINVPAGVFDRTVVLTMTPKLSFPSAQSNLADMAGTGVGVELTTDVNVTAIAPFNIVFAYRDSDVLGLQEARLRASYYIPSQNRWIPLDSNDNPVTNVLSVQAKEIAQYQIMQIVPAADMDRARAYPNPFRPGQGYPVMKMSNLPANADVKIFTLTGGLVRAIRTDAAGQAAWDVKNEEGAKVASGVYLVLFQDDMHMKTMKVVVER